MIPRAGADRNGIADPFGHHARDGYTLDRETGLYLCQNRYYDPGTGRWVTQDPIGFAGGVNLYAYCGGGPIGRSDPKGHQVEEGAEEGGFEEVWEEGREREGRNLEEDENRWEDDGGNTNDPDTYEETDELFRIANPNRSRRPRNVPRNFRPKNTWNDNGIVYENPDCPASDWIRIMDPGVDPRYPDGYARVFHNGQYIDRDGNPWTNSAQANPRKSPDTHIPYWQGWGGTYNPTVIRPGP